MHTSCYVPFFAGQDSLLPSYGIGHKGGLVDRQNSAMWAFRYVQQIATIRYSRMIEDINELQNSMFQRAVTIQRQAAKSLHGNPSALATVANKHADLVVKSWWALADHLIYKYADGNVYTDASNKTSERAPPGYPAWWLEAVATRTDRPHLCRACSWRVEAESTVVPVLEKDEKMDTLECKAGR